MKEEETLAGRLGGRAWGKKEPLLSSKGGDLGNHPREGTRNCTQVLFYFLPTPVSKYSLLGNKTSPILVLFIH